MVDRSLVLRLESVPEVLVKPEEGQEVVTENTLKGRHLAVLVERRVLIEVLNQGHIHHNHNQSPNHLLGNDSNLGLLVEDSLGLHIDGQDLLDEGPPLDECPAPLVDVPDRPIEDIEVHLEGQSPGVLHVGGQSPGVPFEEDQDRQYVDGQDREVQGGDRDHVVQLEGGVAQSHHCEEDLVAQHDVGVIGSTLVTVEEDQTLVVGKENTKGMKSLTRVQRVHRKMSKYHFSTHV